LFGRPSFPNPPASGRAYRYALRHPVVASGRQQFLLFSKRLTGGKAGLIMPHALDVEIAGAQAGPGVFLLDR